MWRWRHQGARGFAGKQGEQNATPRLIRRLADLRSLRKPELAGIAVKPCLLHRHPASTSLKVVQSNLRRLGAFRREHERHFGRCQATAAQFTQLTIEQSEFLFGCFSSPCVSSCHEAMSTEPWAPWNHACFA